MEKTFFEDYEIGEKFITPGRTITETDIINFCGLSGDWHPLHTDVTYAEKTPFGERIAHGALVFAVGSALAFRLGEYVVAPKTFIAFYGLDKMRFSAPTKIGDTIHLELEVDEMLEKNEEMGIISLKGQIKNQNDVVVCSYISRFACGRRPKDID
jgi:3-hydroxybutyryl-CoA dehydratase